MSSQSFERVVLAFKLLDVDGRVDVPMARAAKERDAVVNLPSVKHLLVALVLVT